MRSKLTLVISVVALQALVAQAIIAWSPPVWAVEDAGGFFDWAGGGSGGGDWGNYDFDSDFAGDYGEGTDMDTPITQDQDSPSDEESQQGEETSESEDTNGEEAPPSDFDPAVCSTDNGDTQDGGSASGDTAGTDNNGGDAGCGSDNQNGSNTGSDEGSSNGSSACMNTVGDPIDLSLADKGHVQVDFISKGANPLRLARNYHSNLNVFAARVTIPMGRGWRSGYDRSIQVLNGSSVRLHRGNGRTLDYTFNGAAWVSNMPGGVLSQSGGGWQYVNHRNLVESYGGNGQLLTLRAGGKTTTLGYNGASLINVSNGFGRTLAFSYDGAGRVASVTFPDGNAVVYSYDGNNNLVSTRYADTSVRQYLYENASFPNALTGVVDESGRRRLTWGYDGAGRPNYSHYGNGTNRVSITYNGSQVSTTDARGTVRIRNYGSVNGRTVLTSLQTAATADSATTGYNFNYDGNGNPSQVVSRTGEVRQYSADGRGRMLAATRAVGSSLQLTAQATWHPVYRRRTQFSKGGVTQNATLDGYGRVTQITRTGSNGSTVVVRQRAYNAQNLLQSVTDANGATRSYAYDVNGNVTSVTNALGAVTVFSNYNVHGQVGRIDRPNGAVVQRNYDARGRLVWHMVNGAATTFSYDNAGRLYQKTLPDGSWKRRDYDAAGLVSRITNHRGESTSVGRDGAGKVTSRIVSAANGATTSAAYKSYDSRGRVAAVMDSQNNQTRLNYAADARLSSVTNPLGLNVSQQLDMLNRRTVVTQPNTTAMRQAGGPATVSAYHGYDASSATHRSTVDTVSVATNYSQDAFNRRIAESGNDAGPSSVVRNAAGDVVSVTDARGITLSVARDNLGRITGVTPPYGSSISLSYVTGRSDALVTQMTDPSGSTSWTYDSQGRLLSKSQNNAGSVDKLTISRDSVGRISRMTYPSGMQVDATYSADLLTSLRVNGTVLLNNVGYLPGSQLATSWTWGNGTPHSRSINADGRVTSVSLGGVQRAYSYDAAGRVTRYTDNGAQGTQANNLTYDEAGQLTAYTGPAGNFSFAYDTNGNRRSANQNGYAGTLTYAAGSNRLLTSPRGNYTYDAAGNPTSDGYITNTYDQYGRLTKMATSSDNSVRLYNGQGMRVRSTVSVLYDDCQYRGAVGPASPRRATNTRSAQVQLLSDGKTAKQSESRQPATGSRPAPCQGGRWIATDDTRYLHDDSGMLLGEYNGKTGSVQETIWFNGQPVGTMINGTLYFVRADHLGTPRSISRASDNAEVWRWDGDPFGNNFPTSPASVYITYNLRFMGQQYDPYSGYYYNWMREYDPFTGRYLPADFLGLGGGLSRYAYVGGNPISRIDPMGLASLVFQVGGSYVSGLGGEGNLGAFIGISNGRLDFGVYAQGGLSAGYQSPGVAAQAGLIKGDVNTIRGVTRNLNVAAPLACGTAMTDDQRNLLGATFGLGSKLGGSLTYSDTGAWSASEAFGRLFERVFGRP